MAKFLARVQISLLRNIFIWKYQEKNTENLERTKVFKCFPFESFSFSGLKYLRWIFLFIICRMVFLPWWFLKRFFRWRLGTVCFSLSLYTSSSFTFVRNFFTYKQCSCWCFVFFKYIQTFLTDGRRKFWHWFQKCWHRYLTIFQLCCQVLDFFVSLSIVWPFSFQFLVCDESLRQLIHIAWFPGFDQSQSFNKFEYVRLIWKRSLDDRIQGF